MTKLSVLICDDNAALSKAVTRYLVAKGCDAGAALTIADARRSLESRSVDLLLVDYSLPDGTGAELVEWALPRRRAQVAYCITGVAITANVVAAMRAGCRDVLEKPFDLERLDPLIHAFEKPAESIESWRARFAPDVVGEDLELVRGLSLLRDVADSPSTVLITGESGTGKELYARAVHAASRRRGAFVALNCAALPENLIEAELFGHAKGAFTGAAGARAGHIMAANGGTLFLDEIGDMPLPAQARLLRALQEKQITPLGSDEPVNVDVRVVAATHKNLDDLVEQGRFREDLYFRLSVIPVHVPPLRERPDDILALARTFLARRAKPGTTPLMLTRDAEAALVRYTWPGNIRELINVIEHASLVAKTGVISPDDFRDKLRRLGRGGAAAGSTPKPAAGNNEESLNLRAAIDSVERELIQRALEKTAGNRTEAAALLGLNRTTLVEKLRKLE
jgi:DNA-binding NtrC family response regulator